jgi:hypothetical protein
MGEIENGHNILVGKPEGKNPLEYLGVCVRVYIKELGCNIDDWIQLAQGWVQ